MHDTVITLRGRLGGDVTVRAAGEAQVATFRVACTPRRYHRRSDSWVDGDTQWYSVNAWRALGDNCARSLRRGDPVVVHGRLEIRTWTNQAGEEVTSLEVEATSVGHDLGRGTTRFARTPRPTDTAAAAEPADLVAGDDEGAQVPARDRSPAA